MAIDYAVTLACEPRRHFGNDNAESGTIELLERLKAKGRANMIRQWASQQGKDLSNEKITMNVHDREGNPVQKQVTIAELELEAKVLDGHSSACAGCPANVLGSAYGCYGAIHYPISAVGENWLVSRVEPPESLGAILCGDFMSEFGIKGENTKQLRQMGHFELKQPPKATLKKGFLKSVSVSTNQLFESMFLSGNVVSPSHCFNVLLWFGAIEVEGSKVGNAEQSRSLSETAAGNNRSNSTRFQPGPNKASPGAEEFFTFLKAMYISWTLDVPLYVSA